MDQANGRLHSQPDTEGSGVVGNGCKLRIFWLKTLLQSLPVQTSPCSWVSCFQFALPVCHSTIILGDVLKMDTVSNFLALITVREIGVREAGKGRNPKPQKRRKTFLNSISKTRKSNSPSHSTQPSTPPTWSPTLGRLRKKRQFGEVRRVSSAFTESRIC